MYQSAKVILNADVTIIENCSEAIVGKVVIGCESLFEIRHFFEGQFLFMIYLLILINSSWFFFQVSLESLGNFDLFQRDEY